MFARTQPSLAPRGPVAAAAAALLWGATGTVIAASEIRWTFDPLADDPAFFGKVVGTVVADAGPVPPEFPDLPAGNTAIRFDGTGSRLVVPDPGPASAFDFGLGDTLTLEAWAAPEAIAPGAHAYLVAKGRTGDPGFARDNQNYALRLTHEGGLARPSFLFRSAGPDGGFHRWTAAEGFVPDGSWHHVVVSFTFGEPDSLEAWLDGAPIRGSWDLGGATDRAPVVDDDAIWIGSSQGGSPGNSLRGRIDGVVVRHGAPDDPTARFVRVEPPHEPLPPEAIPAGAVVVQLFENKVISSRNAWPPASALETPADQWETSAFGFARLPVKFDDEGLRADRDAPLFLRAAARVSLPAGRHRLLVRAHSAARLFIDGRRVAGAEIAFPGRFHNAHQPLTEAFLDVAPDIRFAAPGGLEKLVEIEFGEAGEHQVVFETMVGHVDGAGKRRTRAELGETTVSLSPEGESSFVLLGPAGAGPVPFTDAGWETFTGSRNRFHAQRDRERRRLAAASRDAYWARRHAWARGFVAGLPPLAAGSVDAFIDARIEEARASARTATGTVRFHRDVLPILEEHCHSCHAGRKHKGGLKLDSAEAAAAGGDSGDPALAAGRPDESLLLHLVSTNDPDERMPPKGDPLDDDEIAVLATWIREGAPWPDEPILESIEVAAPADDLSFLRRLALDTVGVIPTIDEIEAFLADESPVRRARAIDRYLADPRWADHWTPYWQDVLAENPNILKPNLNNTGPFRWWIHDSLVDDKPFDRFVTELVLMKSGRFAGGPKAFSVATQNDVPLANKAAILSSAFLATEMKCARCHDSPYHETTQEDLFRIAAMLERKPIELPETSSVPVDRLARQPLITVSLRPGTSIEPRWPFGEIPVPEGFIEDPDDPRERLAAILTSPHNLRFARVIVNRLWQRLMGRGIVEPVDDWENAEPSHPGLLGFLAREFMAHGYDLKHVARLVLASEAYQRAVVADHPAPRLFAAAVPRRLTAEQVVDSLYSASGNRMDTEPVNFDIDIDNDIRNFLNLGRPRRAWEFASLSNERDRPSLALPRAQAVVDVLETFGWRGSRQEPVSVRDTEPNVLQPAILANGTLTTWIVRATDESGLTGEALREQPLGEFVDRFFLRMLTRRPTPGERSAAMALVGDGFVDRVVADPAPPPAPDRPRRPRPFIAWSNHFAPRANAIKRELEAEARVGRPPTTRLYDEWRERMEDLAWSLVNAPEFVHYR